MGASSIRLLERIVLSNDGANRYVGHCGDSRVEREWSEKDKDGVENYLEDVISTSCMIQGLH